jgi:hypothetical protein
VIDGTGNIQFYDQGYTYVTQQRSVGVPYVLVQDVPVIPASAVVDIDDNGMATDLDFVITGDGYNTVFGVTITSTIAGAPGSGAVIALLDFNLLPSGEYEWGGSYKIISGGQNYLKSLNFPFGEQVDTFEFDRDDVTYIIYVIEGQYSQFPGSVLVFPGDTHQVDAFYGSGSLTDGKIQFPAFDFYNPES